ncbi:hypothetical protein [Persicirhabdus sediminis]|uniref:Uncharacterized protein n=1 Tax=Persicirhabdus sediminis TaxID=454144 RepID=A0A8J7SNQ8_9BACT|nr:hypothetical protein [Persicirhabdus sediminis]MBK1791838.1 hypothetical protein [Persicirhabdus sediminis]
MLLANGSLSALAGDFVKLDDFQQKDTSKLPDGWRFTRGTEQNAAKLMLTGNEDDMAFGWGVQQKGSIAGVYRPVPELNKGSTYTYYFEFKLAEGGANHSLGFSPKSDPKRFDDYSIQLILSSGLTGETDLLVRNSSEFDVQVRGLSHQPTYSVWLVADYSAKTFDVYLAEQRKLASADYMVAKSVNFRDTASHDVVKSLMLVTPKKRYSGDYAVRINNIYYADGVNLNCPVVQPAR